MNKSAPKVCPECGGPTIWDPESGEEVCGECGLVVSEFALYTGPEFQEKIRVGAPLSFSIYDKGLSTIFRIGRDAYGRRIPPETRPQMFRLRRWHRRSKVDVNIKKNLVTAMSELDRLTENLHIPPPIKETAAVIYRKALKKHLVQGRSISAMADASLYAACRLTQTPRTLGELASNSPIEKKYITRCYRKLLEELDLRMPVPSAQLMVPKIGSVVGVGERTQREAVEILREAERLRMTSGKSPAGLAAAALYIACLVNGENRTQKEIADAAGVTTVTIRNRYKELLNELR